MPVDVFPCTVEELRTEIREGTGVARVALEEGLFLRGKPDELRRLLACDSLDRLPGRE